MVVCFFGCWLVGLVVGLLGVWFAFGGCFWIVICCSLVALGWLICMWLV